MSLRRCRLSAAVPMILFYFANFHYDETESNESDVEPTTEKYNPEELADEPVSSSLLRVSHSEANYLLLCALCGT